MKSESIVNLNEEEFKIEDHEDEIGPVDDDQEQENRDLTDLGLIDDNQGEGEEYDPGEEPEDTDSQMSQDNREDFDDINEEGEEESDSEPKSPLNLKKDDFSATQASTSYTGNEFKLKLNSGEVKKRKLTVKTGKKPKCKVVHEGEENEEVFSAINS